MGYDLDSLNSITFKRTGVIFTKDGVQGKRGTLTAGNVSYETVERGGNYVSLPTGKFLLTMTNDKSRGQVFIVQADGKYGHNVKAEGGGLAGIMIHVAETPSQLLGCLAPGKSFDAKENKLLEGRSAMNEIMTFFGGFGETKLAGWIAVE
jgi:hypothetical protein